jgi:hypothetical protein
MRLMLRMVGIFSEMPGIGGRALMMEISALDDPMALKESMANQHEQLEARLNAVD